MTPMRRDTLAGAVEPGAALRVGLIGYPIAHSRSPALHQAAFDALGIPATYALWETPPEGLAARIAALRAPGTLGANVTIPHKLAAMPLLDAIDASAREGAGAINTIVRRADGPHGAARLIGYNTDVPGLRRALAELGAWGGHAEQRMLILGAGGAAQAALAVARLEGARASVVARRIEAARAALAADHRRAQAGAANHATSPESPDRLAQALSFDDAQALAVALAETSLVVNATPVGTRDPNAAPLALEALHALPPDAYVFDMVYHPPVTALVRAARARGLRASGGLPMLLYQGAESFTLWTGRPAPLAVMRAALGIADAATDEV